MNSPKTYEVGLSLLIHAQSQEEALAVLEQALHSSLAIPSKEVRYCEENIGISYVLN